jgi:hypothetical protein
MNAFQLKEYLRYRRTAKGRHGVHSPAVYRFVAEALRPPDKRFKNTSPYHSESGELLQTDMLMRRIVHHFHFKKIVVHDADDQNSHSFQAASGITDDIPHETYDRLLDWHAISPERWTELFRKNVVGFGGKDVITVSGIHQSATHVAAWQALTAQPEVRLSIDLFTIGLLFFSEDFKERQHFVLKYPL